MPLENRGPTGRLKLGILASHPIQYQTPLFRELATRCDLHVYFAHSQTPQAQAAAGFGVAFEWDVDLLSGYEHSFLRNLSWRPNSGAFFGCDTPAIASEIESGDFNVFLVMGWHLKCFWQAIRACQRRGVPVMVRGDSQLGTPRSLLKQAVKALLYPWVIRQFDACLYVGERNREYLAHYGAHADRLFFAPHCVDTKAFAEAAGAVNRDAVRASWGLVATEKVVLFAGKLIGRKRPADLVQAVARLHVRGHAAVLVWAGDGPDRQALAALGASLDVPMVFLGFCNQSQLPAVYRAADVLALPSEGTETWGLVVNEAMACGTPCVVSDACGCAPNMIVPGVSGAIFGMGDVDALAMAMHGVLMAPLMPQPIQDISEDYSVAIAANGILAAAANCVERSKL
ncbi:MAG: glycosyltransferase family 4 protein [Aeromicrobium sp.]|nr:glycosyltransferase family 4 protein [Burkholderiales bacterium]